MNQHFKSNLLHLLPNSSQQQQTEYGKHYSFYPTYTPAQQDLFNRANFSPFVNTFNYLDEANFKVTCNLRKRNINIFLHTIYVHM